MTNVIPLYERRELPRNQAHTHFDRAALIKGTEYEWDLDDDESLTTLCGREAVGYLDKDTAYPDCAECIAEWSRVTGWAFPLPAVVCTD